MRGDRFTGDEVDFLVRFIVADDHDFGLHLVSAARSQGLRWTLPGIVHVFIRWTGKKHATTSSEYGKLYYKIRVDADATGAPVAGDLIRWVRCYMKSQRQRLRKYTILLVTSPRSKSFAIGNGIRWVVWRERKRTNLLGSLVEHFALRREGV